MEVTQGDKKKQEEIIERVKDFMSERIGCLVRRPSICLLAYNHNPRNYHEL